MREEAWGRGDGEKPSVTDDARQCRCELRKRASSALAVGFVSDIWFLPRINE